jgi:hypothetical protein
VTEEGFDVGVVGTLVMFIDGVVESSGEQECNGGVFGGLAMNTVVDRWSMAGVV